MTKLLRMAALVAALSLFAAACGDDDEGGQTPTSGAEDEGATPADEDGGVEGEGSGAAGALEFTAVDIDFEEAEATGAAGELDVTLTNEGAIEHSWVVEGHEADLRLYTQQSGATDQGTMTLDAGEYTYYCDIPGHRQAGMEGTLTVE